MSLLLSLLLLQSGPSVSGGTAPAIRQPPLREGGLKPRRGATVEAPPEPLRLAKCLAATGEDAEAAAESAQAWLKEATGSASAEPLLCLGTAQAAQEDWDEAGKNFIAGRDIAAASDRVLRARLGAMAGNAALAQGDPARALPTLDTALKDAEGSADPHLRGDIAMDRARALVMLKRDGEAAAALVEARTESPNNPQAWLLSATLSRRMNKLAQAQAQIQTAADLAPTDPDIGIEAGVIAVLGGREEAARKSWASVVAAAPASPQAATAKAYLAQLGPAVVPVTGK